MDPEKLSRLEERLYNETPLVGNRIRQQAAKELARAATPAAVKLLCQVLTFTQDRNIHNIAFSTLRQIKSQQQEWVDAACEVWGETREPELAKFLKLKGWVASQPGKLRILTALKIGWQGVLEETGVAAIAPLLALLEDRDPEISDRAREWALSLKSEELQQEVCRLAAEENNQIALEIVTKTGYAPREAKQAALFFFLTEQWQLYQQVDPRQELLAAIYDGAPSELRGRIDEKGQDLLRIEWVWMLIGGREGERLGRLKEEEWQKILTVLSRGKYWPQMWSIALISPVIWAKAILEKLHKKKWFPSPPEQLTFFNNCLKLIQYLKTKGPPKGKLVRCLNILRDHNQGIEAIAITPDSNLLASAGGDLIRIWRLDSGELQDTLKGHLKSVTCLCLSEGGSLLASGSRDKTICLWRLPEGTLLGNFSAAVASIWSLAMTGDGKLLASGSYQEIRLWQYPSGKLLNTIRAHRREVEVVKITPDNFLLISGGGWSDNKVRIWRLPQGQLLHTLERHSHGITCLDVDGESSLLVTGSQDCTVRLWKLPGAEAIATLRTHRGAIRCLAISPDGTLLATGSDDRQVKLWSLPEGKLIKTLTGHGGAIWCLTISGDGKILVTGSKDGTVKLWRLPDGENIATLTGHEQGITCLALSADGEKLVSGSKDKTLRLWKWDVPRLCSLPLRSIADGDREWIQEALVNPDITPEERYWLMFLQQLLDFNSGNSCGRDRIE